MTDRLLKDVIRAMMHSPLSIDALAARAGVSRSTLDNWIDGKVPGPRLITIAKVAKALDLHLTAEHEPQQRAAYDPIHIAEARR